MDETRAACPLIFLRLVCSVASQTCILLRLSPKEMLHSSIHFIEVTFVFSSSEHNSLGCFYKTNDDNSRILLDFARLGIPQENLIRKSNGNDVVFSPIENVDVEILLNIWGVENLVDRCLHISYRCLRFRTLRCRENELASMCGARHHFWFVAVRQDSTLKKC